MKQGIDDAPIMLPGSPFWSVFRRFGRDELIAMIINVIGTAIVNFFIAIPLILSIAGPILEKIGFFPAHLRRRLMCIVTLLGGGENL